MLCYWASCSLSPARQQWNPLARQVASSSSRQAQQRMAAKCSQQLQPPRLLKLELLCIIHISQLLSSCTSPQPHRLAHRHQHLP